MKTFDVLLSKAGIPRSDGYGSYFLNSHFVSFYQKS